MPKVDDASIVSTCHKFSFAIDGLTLVVVRQGPHWAWHVYGRTPSGNKLIASGFHGDVYTAIEVGKEWIANAK